MQFKYKKFAEEIVRFSPRQFENETKTADFIMQYLSVANIPTERQYFSTSIPRVLKELLEVDGTSIPVRACCFVSGIIRSKDSLVSSLIGSRFLIEQANINFNPRAIGISTSNHYFAPSLAINKNNLLQVMNAKEIRGEVEIERVEHVSSNILVGNTINPRVIYFAHYDSILTGAIDNASGVCVLMGMIMEQPELRQTCLFVFAGNEELSYDNPTYWGKGFRAFQEKYGELFVTAEKIMAVDCVGNGAPIITQDAHIVNISFPINNIETYQSKISSVYGDLDDLLKVYHSAEDTIDHLDEDWLRITAKELSAV